MSFNKKIAIIITGVLLLLVIIISMVFILKIKENPKQEELDKVEEAEVDTTPPMIVLDDTYAVKKGYDKNLVDVIMSADDIDPNPKREIIGEYDVNTVGEYNLTYKIEDASGNKTQKDFTLKVKENNTTYKEDTINFQDAVKEHKTENTKIGIDVSKWQEEINWEEVKKENVEFAILRMGYQKGFDGEVLLDPYFEQNVNGCKQNNIPIAIYFSSYAKSKEESQNHAKWVYENLQKMNLANLTVAFDWENWNSFNTLGISLNDINDIADIFMEECENFGLKSMLYGSKTYLEEVWQNSNNYPIWLANYVSKTSYEKPYKLWQICQTGKISGITGNIDINVFYE